MKKNTAYLIQGEALDILRSIPGNSVDLVLCDPPYGTIQGMDYGLFHSTKGKTKHGKISWDTVIPTDKLFKELGRVLRLNGRAVFTATQPYTTELINNSNSWLTFNYTAVYNKQGVTSPLLANKALLKAHEDILIFTKPYPTETQPNLEYARKLKKFLGKTAKDIMKETETGTSLMHFFCTGTPEKIPLQFSIPTEEAYKKLTEVYNLKDWGEFKEFKELAENRKEYHRNKPKTVYNLNGRKSRNTVFTYKRDAEKYHPTQKPVALMEELISIYSNPGDTVLDFTMGSGTTGVASVKQGRNFIGIELDRSYTDIADKRIREAAEQVEEAYTIYTSTEPEPVTSTATGEKAGQLIEKEQEPTRTETEPDSLTTTS